MLKMFVLVRRDILPLPHCVCQGIHASVEYVHYYNNDVTKKWVEEDKTIIVLSATEEQIENKKRLFSKLGLTHRSFHEPDMSDVLTATAFQPVSSDDGKLYFGELSLLK